MAGLLEAARSGDEAAFGRLVEPYRGEVLARLPDQAFDRRRLDLAFERLGLPEQLPG